MPHAPEASRLLSALAGALNACDRAGLRPKLRHGGVIETKGGFVIRSEAGWVPRTLAWTLFSPDGDSEDE